jgi:t-SNARE complex subunit (syntaxin)
MTNLVMAQSETISRIEDDVEDSLQNVAQAHESMQSFAEVTKGNRGMILKVFGLLIFFIFVFLVWT